MEIRDFVRAVACIFILWFIDWLFGLKSNPSTIAVWAALHVILCAIREKKPEASNE